MLFDVLYLLAYLFDFALLVDHYASYLDVLYLGAYCVGLAVHLLLCMFGDYLYYRHCVKRIKQIRMNYSDGSAPGYYEALSAKGSPSWLRAIIAILAVYLLQAIMLLYILQANSGMTGTLL